MLGQHGCRRLGADDEDPAHAAGRVGIVDGTVAVGPVAVREPAVAAHGNEGVLPPHRPAARHHLRDLRPDDVPDLGPDLGCRPAQRARMPLRPDEVAEGVVVEAGEVRPPVDGHGVAGVEHDPHGRAQRLRPGRRRAEGRHRPVVRPQERAECAAIREEGRCGHGEPIRGGSGWSWDGWAPTGMFLGGPLMVSGEYRTIFPVSEMRRTRFPCIFSGIGLSQFIALACI
jgi:hypothetical protein